MTNSTRISLIKIICYSNIDLVKLAGDHLLPLLLNQQHVTPMCNAGCMPTIVKIRQILYFTRLSWRQALFYYTISLLSLRFRITTLCIEWCSVLYISRYMYYLHCRHIYNAKLYRTFIKMLNYLLDNNTCVSVDKKDKLASKNIYFFLSVKTF